MAKQIKQKKKRNFKFLWAILVLVICPTVFNLLGATMTKRYTSEMRIMVDESQQGTAVAVGPFAPFDDIQAAGRPRSATTQLDVITGTTVLENAYQLAADRIPDKLQKNGDPSAIYEDFVRRLGVDNEPTSDIISVRVTEDDPTVAAELANDVGLAYIDYTKKLSKESSELMSQELKLEIDPLKAKLQKIDADIRALKDKSQIYDVNALEANAGSTKEVADRSLANAMAQYDGSKAQLAVSEAQLAKIPMNIESSSHTQLNPVYVSLQTAFATESVALAQLKAQYQDSFPLVVEEQKKINDLKNQMKGVSRYIPSGVDRSVNPVYQTQLSNLVQLRAQVQAYESQLASAREEQARSTSTVSKIPLAEQQLQALKRDQATYEQTYEQLAQRLSTAQQSSQIQRPPAEIVSPALPPQTPSFPDKKLLSVTGLALGIFLAVLILMPRPQVVTQVPEPYYEPEAPASGEENSGAQALAEALRKAGAPKPLGDEDRPAAPSIASGSASSV